MYQCDFKINKKKSLTSVLLLAGYKVQDKYRKMEEYLFITTTNKLQNKK